MSLAEKAIEAVRDPQKVPPYLRRQALGVLRNRATIDTIADLPRQRQRLETLRQQGDYLLVVLDACRYPEFIRHARPLFTMADEPVASEGHDTFEWLQRCWPDEYPHVTYVSGATPVASTRTRQFDDDGLEDLYEGYLPPEHLGEIVDVWDSGWDRSVGTVPPERVVAATIDRLDEPELVSHLFQPHAPYIGAHELLGHTDSRHAAPDTGEPIDAPLWDRVKYGDVSDEQLVDVYRSNLVRALEAVCWLVAETDRTVYVVGDHGEALGEYGVYSHPRIEHPEIRRVPWARVTGVTSLGGDAAARARERYEPADSGTDGDVAGRLDALGYR